MRRYRLPLIIVLAALVVFVGLRVRAVTDGTYRTQRQLQQVPEKHLFYPGAVELSQFGADRRQDLTGQRIRAKSAHVLGTNATEAQVMDFYRERLSAQGWRESAAEAIRGTAQSRVAAYRKDALLVQIAILRKNDVSDGSATDTYQTPYQITLYADMPK